MTPTRPIQRPGSWTPHLRWVFAFIIAGFILSSGVSMYEMRSTQTNVRTIVERTLASIQLSSWLERDIGQVRLLFDAHITESDSTGMKRIEQEVEKLNVRIAATLKEYEPMIRDETERAAWLNLQAQINGIQTKVSRVIELSRMNLDNQARSELNALEPQFETIGQTIDSLVRLNRLRADQEVEQINYLQRLAMIILATLTAIWAAAALLAARWVTRLITEREAQMMNATSQLEERNRELDAFAGRVAHDLRSPLTAISLAAFSNQSQPSEKTSAIFRRGVNQMSAIIQDLLTLSRVSAQTTSAICETAIIAASADEDLRPRVEEVGGELHIDMAVARVSCSEGLLRQVISNLGENAVKYRRADVQLLVGIRGRLTRDDYEFQVSDNGAGMSPMESRNAFEPFYRGEHVRATPGTGLGLSIVKRIIEASGGSISLESQPGHGTIFHIHLPLASRKAA